MTPQEKTKKAVEEIFKSFALEYGLQEFSDYKLEEILEIREKEAKRYYLKDLKSGTDRFVLDLEKQTAKPEEIVRQLWLYKLNKHYKYPFDRIDTEKSIHFGREIHAKAADIVVYKPDKVTPYIIIEVKSPSQEKGIEQLKSYLSAEGSEIGLWSNGNERVILYRPYPKEYQPSAIADLPRADQTVDDLLEEKKTLFHYTKHPDDLKSIIKIMEELVLANAGVDVFTEVFKLIYAKLYDEIEAKNSRQDQEILFRRYADPNRTYHSINELFKKAIDKWPGTFYQDDKIRLTPDHLSTVVAEMEKVRLFGSDLKIIDEAFEYLIPEVAKGKKGQYFTPRHVIAMAVKMLNPKPEEYIIDPAAGSGGFLIAAMNWAKENYFNNNESQTQEYAKKYLWGIDFAEEISKVSRALMLIAGDGRSNMFKINSLDPREWQGEDEEVLEARRKLRTHLLKMGNYAETQENEKTFQYFNFDVLFTNPPFAGEIKDPGVLRQYFFGKRNGKVVRMIERHILFIERVLDMLRPGGRLAIVLPQGVFNNTNMEYVRQYLFDKARILAVVGLHGNTFKPHTGTKTSVLFLQKWAEKEKLPKDYPIFMAVSKKSGKDNSGEYIYKKDEKGQFVHDAKGRRLLDHDLDAIAEEFVGFARENKFEFWR